MERGSYVAASGGLLQFRKLEVVNNNLANVNTPGFKRQLLVGQEQTFDQTLAAITAGKDPYAAGDHKRTAPVINIETRTDFTPGPIKPTGNPFDAALQHPNDFFEIETPDGPRYTRAGNFTLNVQGELVNHQGLRVMGDGGPITISRSGASISPDGSVRAAGIEFGKIKVVRMEDTSQLRRDAGTLFVAPQGGAAPAQVEAELVPSALEMANVSAVSSVVDLITANRAFDMYTKTARTIDELNQTSITQIGRRR